jgi:aminoglycoside phosphotransferase (APT) family kinase protein
LSKAFGPRALEVVRVLSGGASGALICRIEVAGRAYVLRLEPERIEIRHRERGYAAMCAAAAVGVAPAVRFADPVSGVAVMDFVEARPLSDHPGGTEGLVRELGGLIARVQQTPLFAPLAGPGDVVAGLLQHLANSGLFAPGLLAPHAEALARIRRIRPWAPPTLASSHNDPNPRNMIFDGARVWLVDWELACRNDPLFDLAILTLELATTPALEDVLLTTAFGQTLGPDLKAQLSLVRLLARLFYGCIALDAFADELRERPQTTLDALTPEAFRAAAPAMSPSRIAWAFGLMSLRAFIDGLRAPEVRVALS